ncbi:MAG TPA: thioredoxin family protein [Thermoanaerobaculia bacterium]|jgi:thiol-disulfide isomerase/thioredoxin
MKVRAVPPLLLAVLVLACLACASANSAGQARAGEETKKDAPVLVGPTTREGIEAAVPAWVQAEVEAQPDAEAARALAAVEPGAEVTVFLGTWCDDSRREVPRLWKALDETGGAAPFQVRYVGVDRAKKEPAAAIAESGVLYLPTFIVHRDGREVGRIVETSPHGVEKDLLALLTGQASGVIATREDLTSGDSPEPPF